MFNNVYQLGISAADTVENMKKALLTGAVLMAAVTTQATQIFEFTYGSVHPDNSAPSRVMWFFTQDNDDNLKNYTQDFPVRTTTILSASNIPDVWNDITDGVSERFGFYIGNGGFAGPEPYFWGIEPDLAGTGITYIRVQFLDRRTVTFTGFDGPVPTPDGGTPAALLGLTAGALAFVRRCV